MFAAITSRIESRDIGFTTAKLVSRCVCSGGAERLMSVILLSEC
jgi:hypothetical protein